jgi:hypothetical protein
MKIPIIANTKNRSDQESFLRLKARGDMGCCESGGIGLFIYYFQYYELVISSEFIFFRDE